MAGITFERLKYEIEKRPCVCCGGGPCGLDHINGINPDGVVNPKAVWPLCRAHKREKDNFGLCQLLKWHRGALLEYEKLGYPQTPRKKTFETVAFKGELVC